ncbi:MAG: TIGR03905 family TSCPD domain-containing protein [Bacilli bacterium]|nr:TIGR03905 family TSCPD domain-containing protein [Bacilli bacterium]MBO6284795.1 TIGR03905 family TSCPD domain-containing protein [Bacilli bacterium]
MEQTFAYKPQHVCASGIEITHEDGIVKKVVFIGGCPGNTQAVAALCQGRSVKELIGLLEGIVCKTTREARTSCPAQLANALKSIE